MSSWLIDPTTAALSSALDGLALREASIAANIANVDTPGYKAADVGFEQELALAMAGEGTSALGMNQPTTPPPASEQMRFSDLGQLKGTGTESAVPAMFGISTQPQAFSQRVDGNGVDVDTQMTSLAVTQLKYAATSRMLTGKLNMLRDVVAR